MKLNQNNEIPSKWLTTIKIGFFFLLLNSLNVKAQSVSRVQDLNFGDFIPFGQGGTLSVSPDGIRNYTGEIIPKSFPTPAIFDLYVGAGKTVQLTYNKNVTLNGNHGGTITLLLSDSSPTGNGSIVTGPSPTRINLGGTLTIGSSSLTPVGSYSGFLQLNITVNN